MPIKSRHISMSYEDWELLPYEPGWKYEYYGGQAHITPRHQLAVTVVTVTPRMVESPCLIRKVVAESDENLLPVYLETFADNQAFCDCTEAEYIEAARKDLQKSFRGSRAPLLSASRIAVNSAADAAPIIGAALLSKDRKYGPVMDLIFVQPASQRRRLATALLSDAMNELYRSGEQTITSCYQLANSASQSWHRAFGFVEKPDLHFAHAYHRRAVQELTRLGKMNVLTCAKRAALAEEIKQWGQRIDELEHMLDELGPEAVYPRLPHH